jgi:hypothetical protein
MPKFAKKAAQDLSAVEHFLPLHYVIEFVRRELGERCHHLRQQLATGLCSWFLPVLRKDPQRLS